MICYAEMMIKLSPSTIGSCKSLSSWAQSWNDEEKSWIATFYLCMVGPLIFCAWLDTLQAMKIDEIINSNYSSLFD